MPISAVAMADMYTPPQFRVEDPAEIRAMIEAARLALLVCQGEDGVPSASHLPLLFDPEDGPHGALVGHLARANPQLRALAAAGQALAIFTGPEAYVSPNWYPSKAEHGRVVPTWNYVAVHASGPVEVFDDPVRLHEVVSRLTRRHEAAQPAPWAVTDAPEAFVAGQLKGITGLRLRITSLIGKRKMSQNRGPADRAGVAAGLAASDDPRDRDAGALVPG